MTEGSMTLSERRDLAQRLREEGVDVSASDDLLARIPIILNEYEARHLVDRIECLPVVEQRPSWSMANRADVANYVAAGFGAGVILCLLAAAAVWVF